MCVTEEHKIGRGLLRQPFQSVHSVLYPVKIAVSKNYATAFYVDRIGLLQHNVTEGRVTVTVTSYSKKSLCPIRNIRLKIRKSITEEKDYFGIGMKIKRTADCNTVAVRIRKAKSFHITFLSRFFINVIYFLLQNALKEELMRFNKSQLEALAALPDDRLWDEVIKIASGFGYSLPKNPPSHEELEKMRDIVRGDKINPSEALRLVNQYKKTGRIG